MGALVPASTGGDETYTRLHITPFDPDLLKVVLPTSVAHEARNVSFHTLETFPEKRYGFVDLPHMAAEKLRKKLNGATLKGTKVRIETARPEEREQPDEATPKPEGRNAKDGSKERKKKRKREVDVLEGVKLEDRKVKRGWTETPEEASKKTKRSKGSKDKDKTKDGDKNTQRKRVKSKYTDEAECLLNTKVPPNALKNLTASETASKKRKKDKSRQVTIHEFEKTTKFPSFLKNAPSAEDGVAAAEFVEGKGWIDTQGNVVEEVKPKLRPEPTKKLKKKPAEPVSESLGQRTASNLEDSDDTSSSGSSSEDNDPSCAASDSASSQSLSSPSVSEQPKPAALANSEKIRPMSSSSSRSLSIKIPPPITPSSTKVHPLEALYKRVQSEEGAAETPAQEQPFSFFGGGEEDENVPASSQPAMPMTPFTRQDLEWRNIRSAAPTPDTAHPSRVRNFWATVTDEEKSTTVAAAADDDVDDLREEEEDDEPLGSNAGASQKSEFQDWFWENRRDLNRSWMRRRKASAKEKRHRDNKARASRVF
jgi:hypothetical protein